MPLPNHVFDINITFKCTSAETGTKIIHHIEDTINTILDTYRNNHLSKSAKPSCIEIDMYIDDDEII